MQEIRNPAGQGQGFKDYRGDESFPQTNIEANYQDYQELFDLVEVRSC